MIPASGSCRNLQERSEEITGSCRKAPEIAGCGSSIPTGNLLDFFPVNSISQFPAGTGQKSSGNDRKISGGNTASGMDRDFAGSHRFLPYVFDSGQNKYLKNPKIFFRCHLCRSRFVSTFYKKKLNNVDKINYVMNLPK